VGIEAAGVVVDAGIWLPSWAFKESGVGAGAPPTMDISGIEGLFRTVESWLPVNVLFLAGRLNELVLG